MRLVSITDPERAELARLIFPDNLIPVEETAVLAVTPHSPLPEVCYLVDLERISADQQDAIARLYGERFELAFDEAQELLARDGMPIPIEGTILIVMQP